MTADIARIVANKIKIGFANKFLGIYNSLLTEDDFTPDKVLACFKTEADIFKLVEDDNEPVLETAPPYDETPAPNLKWVAPMELVREYVQAFDPVEPYDEQTDQMIKTPMAGRFEVECGAVVYAKNSTTKQLNFLYNCVVNFIKSLEGSVLVIGDNGGAIAYRTRFEHAYTMYRREIDFEVLKESNRKGVFIHEDEYDTLFDRRHFDHIVVFLYSYDFEFPETSQVHYVSLVPGTSGISQTSLTNEFLINGKIVTFHPWPTGDLICHTSLFPVYDALDHFVIWRTPLQPTRYACSIAPLTNISRLGPINEVMISEKMDGQPYYFELKDNVAYIRDFDGVIQFHKPMIGLNQLLVLEKVDEIYYVVEPLYCSGCGTFGEWLLKGRYLKIADFRFKKWHPFPLDLNWSEFASDEGVVIKSKTSICGYRDVNFRKLSTYYLKLPKRVTYEDFVEKVEVEKTGRYLFKGYHNVYSDEQNVFKLPGIYEVNVSSLNLYRHREKKQADPTWYVTAVSEKIDFDKVFTIPLNFVRFIQTPNQGLSGMRTIKSHNVSARHVIDEGKGHLSVNFKAEIGSLLNYCNKYYVVSNSYEGHSTATTRTEASLMG